MLSKIYPSSWLRVALLLAAFTAPAGAQCPAEAGSAIAAGWRSYRVDSLAAAEAFFLRGASLCPASIDAASGLGYIALRNGALVRADSLFRSVVLRDPRNADGWDGVARTAERSADTSGAIAAAARLLALHPGDAFARDLLARLAPDRGRPLPRPIKRPRVLQLVARTRGARFEVARGGAWQPIYIKGVNLGVTLPGRHPAEFPQDSVTYADWLSTIASLSANTVRVYTILPPAFYRALRGWNTSHPRRPLWLIHGVWTELPPGDDFGEPQWQVEFGAEMRRVVDVVHGTVRLEPRLGHAAGRYDADVSRWTLGYIIGREWEPFAVKAYDAAHPALAAMAGRFLTLRAGTAMDAWLVARCDEMLAYEAQRYNALRPIAYTNWPTLDPLAHPTEANADEESGWRSRRGAPLRRVKLEYENDAVALDATLVRPTAANPAGWFASYHAYPYYPDFMIHDPGYNAASSSEGRSNYFGYVSALRRYHGGVPLLIAEYGVPSSRGDAHLQPQGFDHGGHDEVAMAAIDARLSREIHEAGAAGAILFSWMDEWFKRNWMVTDFEIPGENTPRWSNVMDAEQHYGLLGQYPGSDDAAPTLGGDPSRWLALPPLAAAGGGRPGMRAGSDAAYIYLAVDAAGVDWARDGIEIGVDTYLPGTGQHLLPRSGIRSPLGFEFAIELVAPDSGALRVIPSYNRYAALDSSAAGDDRGEFYHRPVTIADAEDGRFDPMFVISNRARFGRDGSFFPAAGYDRGRLRYGTGAASTLSDWYRDPVSGLLELRIPWDLLNVTDPSTRTLLYETAAGDTFGTATADSFHFLVAKYSKSGGVPRELSSGSWAWSGWTLPASHARLKPAADSMRATWKLLFPRRETR